MQLSFIIPVYNEADNIEQLSSQIRRLEAAGHEVIVVDGGSQDSTATELKNICEGLIVSGKGRAQQMNAGARQANGEVLVFLHADTSLPTQVVELIGNAISVSPWGRFDVRLAGKKRIFRLIEKMMNLRSCVTGIATGDQCIFVNKALFDQVEGYPEIPLMEDVAISRKLKKVARPFCIHDRVITSSRRWESNGIIRTVVLMWVLRLAYFFRVSPHRLYQLYYPE